MKKQVIRQIILDEILNFLKILIENLIHYFLSNFALIKQKQGNKITNNVKEYIFPNIKQIKYPTKIITEFIKLIDRNVFK